MRVKDLGLGPPTQGLNIDTSLSSSNHYRVAFFNFVSLSQIESVKLRVFALIALFYSLIQNIYISFWPYLELAAKDIVEKHDYVRTPLYFEENLTNVLFFYSTENETTQLYLISFIIFGIAFFFFFLSLLCFCLFFFKHIINSQLLFCYNFFIRFICPIVTVPLSFQSGWLITKVSMMNIYEEGGTNVFIIIIVLDIILYIIIISMTIVTNIFNSKSIIIVDYHSVPDSGLFQSYIILFPSLILFLSNVLPLFYSNLRYFVIGLHMLFCVSVAIWSFWIPYGKVLYNSFVASVSISMLISDINCFTAMNAKWIRYIIFIGCFIILFIIMNLLIKLRIRLLLKTDKSKESKYELTEYDDALNSRSKSLKFQLFGDTTGDPTGFENLSVSKALFVLRVAIIQQSPVFLDGKLLDLIASKVYTDEEKIQLSYLICYFPEFQSIFFALLTGLKHARFLPFLREFQLFQLRCYDVCCHSGSKVEGLEEAINETSALDVYLRSYWQVIDSECSSDNKNEKEEKKYRIKSDLFGQFDRLSRAVFNLQSKWHSIINMYPNNVQVSTEYAKFLISCCGDFTGASEWKTVSILLQDGKVYKVNPAQISFLRAFPFYVKKVLSKTTLMKTSDDIEFQSKIENIQDLIEMPEARFEFQRSVQSSFPFSYYLFMLISVASLLFTIIFSIYGICCFDRFDNMIYRLNFLAGTSSLAQQISINLILGIMDSGQLPEVDLFPLPEEVFNVIFPNGFNDRIGTIFSPSLILLNGDYKSQLFDSAQTSIETMNFLRNSALKQIEKGNDFQDVLDVFYNHSVSSNYYITKDEKVASTISLQSLLFSHITYYFTMSFVDNYEYLDDPLFYHSLSAGDIVLNTLDKVSDSIINSNSKALNQSGFLYNNGLILLAIVYVIVSVLFIWIDFIFIYRNFKTVVNSLCYFPKSVKQKAASSSILNSVNNDDDDQETTNIDDSSIIKIRSKIKNVVIVCLCFDTLISLALGGLMVFFQFINNEYKSNFISILELSHYYLLETSKTVEVVYSLMAGNCFHRILPMVDQKYKERVSIVLNEFVRIHQQCWNYSVEGDCGIKGEYLTSINDLKNQEKCPDFPNKTYHELIGCLAEEPAVNAFIDMTKTLIGKIIDPNLFDTPDFKYYVHFTFSHLYYDIQNFPHFLSMGADSKQEEYSTIIIIFGSLSIVIACVLFILKIFIFIKMRDIFMLLFTFISRILPSDLIENSHLLCTLLGIKNNNKALIENGAISFLVQESSTPIIFLDRATLIEFINNAFSVVFGYEPNFIVGQSISTLIDDESVLFYIDSMKFFETRKCDVKTIWCKKGKGNKALFDVTFIPIHSKSKNKIKKRKIDKDTCLLDLSDDDDIDDVNNGDDNNKSTFIHCIALVFVEKTTEINLQKKCNALKIATDKIANSIFPQLWKDYINGNLKMCAVCIIKFLNTFPTGTSSSRILAHRQTMYDMLYEKIQIYPLLVPVNSKNGMFTVVGYKKNDPAELAIECLNFIFNIINEMSDRSSNPPVGAKLVGPLFAVVETGGELEIGWVGNDSKKTILTGELIETAVKVLDNASLAGTVCVSSKTYNYIMQHDYIFNEKKISEEICGANEIYSVECGNVSKKLNKNVYSDDSNATGFSTSFIEKLKEEGSDD